MVLAGSLILSGACVGAVSYTHLKSSFFVKYFEDSSHQKAVILVMLKNSDLISEICKISGATEETALEIKESVK